MLAPDALRNTTPAKAYHPSSAITDSLIAAHRAWLQGERKRNEALKETSKLNLSSECKAEYCTMKPDGKSSTKSRKLPVS
jgi:hypothetical protein